ncbi:MAG: tartrate dehydrogenase [Planctomycetes bacterium]|jgi:tartrate dehydrogenase/decarboxylase/D-malate dehydrogenase|nr:tartrate dehydrogenase [Planctomycetota bacterium]
MTRKYRLAVVPGDGIGWEIVPVGVQVLQAAAARGGFELATETFPYGAAYYQKTGQFLPDEGLDILRKFDAIYFGAVGLPEVDDTLPAKLFTFHIRKSFNQYVNYRPARLLPGIRGPLRNKTAADIDFIVIRENTEGEFVQVGGFVRPEAPEGFALDTSVFTRQGIERVAHYSFRLAQRRRRRVTSITKSNTLIHSLAFWDRVIAEVSRSYPDVTYRKMYVDNASANFVLHPEYFDVILTTNFIGDILSDLGGAIMGSLGLGPSGNINPEKEFPSMFEPIHGSAPDIAGQGIANPIGTIWAGALMLEHLGESQAAGLVVRAIEKTVQDGVLTADLGGTARTIEVAQRVIQNVREL